MRLAVAVLLALIGYELIRWALLRTLRERMHRRARRFAQRHGVRVDLFKFGGKVLVREELLNDRVVQRAMLAAGEAGEPAEEVRRRVEGYIDEIVPAFSLAAYYEVGMKLARAAIGAAYRPVLARPLRELPRDATAVFLINHRSNFDYVVVGWALSRRVAISYAVGEWARVFPLDALFKAFGGFFVRRGFPDPLYHTVLRRYLQLITRQGVTQGIFPEGGLTRDGALRSPKVGLLDALLQLSAEPGFDRDLLFVPVGINYDRVLEDEALLAEKRGREQPPGAAEKLRGAVRLLWIVPSRILVNLVRAAFGRLHRSGYVALGFGEPVSFRRLAAAHGWDLSRASDEERRAIAKEVARDLMGCIARSIPATPVPLVARAVLDLREASRARLAERVRDLRGELEALGVPTALGEEFESQRQGREQLLEREDRNRDLARLEADVLALEEAEEIVRIGVERLSRRKIVASAGAAVRVGAHPHALELLEYYARSLAVLDEAPATQTRTAVSAH
ncbi:MAG TPA: 1-acyl-sn-glycerol-3-phosphate acyltransferase [Myxococcales bacterium]|nr:1-acyl-sn-glycerol-3-phosphate acyltransferase [Myxococcales bacterium]